MIKNLSKIFRYTPSLIVWIFTFLVTFLLWYRYSDVEYVAANYRSHSFAYFDIFLSWMMLLLLPIMLAGIMYRSMHFGVRRIHNKKRGGIFGIVGGVLSTFITGVACCGVSLISVLGLTSVISFLDIFPYHGIELKALGIVLLFFATHDLVKHLEVCSIPKK